MKNFHTNFLLFQTKFRQIINQYIFAGWSQLLKMTFLFEKMSDHKKFQRALFSDKLLSEIQRIRNFGVLMQSEKLKLLD